MASAMGMPSSFQGALQSAFERMITSGYSVTPSDDLANIFEIAHSDLPEETKQHLIENALSYIDYETQKEIVTLLKKTCTDSSDASISDLIKEPAILATFIQKIILKRFTELTPANQNKVYKLIHQIALILGERQVKQEQSRKDLHGEREMHLQCFQDS